MDFAAPNGTILNGSDSQLLEEDEDVRRVVVTRDGGGGFGLVLDNGNGGVIISNVYGSARGRVHVGEQLLDVYFKTSPMMFPNLLFIPSARILWNWKALQNS